MHPYGNKTLKPVELGASIFVTEANMNMYRATQQFGIDTFDFGEDDSDMGVWDGQKFLITVCLQMVRVCILPLILTPAEAYRPGLPGKVVGHVQSPMEIWVPLA